MSRKILKQEMLLIAITLILVMVDVALLTSQIWKLQKEISGITTKQQEIVFIKKRLTMLEDKEEVKVVKKIKKEIATKQEIKPKTPDYKKQIEVEEELINKGDGWVTYRNKTQGYEISYPETWYNSWKNNPAINREPTNMIHSYTIINELTDYIFIPTGDIKVEINIYNNFELKNQTLKDWVYNTKNDKEAIIDIKTIKIDNHDAVVLISDLTRSTANQDYGHNSSYSNITRIINNGKLYTISARTTDEKYYKEYEPIWEKIINSFKFIDNESQAGWQTYKNEKYNYQIKFPPDWKINSATSDSLTIQKKNNTFNISIPPLGFDYDINEADISEAIIDEIKTERLDFDDLVVINFKFNNTNGLIKFKYEPGNKTENLETFNDILNTLQFSD